MTLDFMLARPATVRLQSEAVAAAAQWQLDWKELAQGLGLSHIRQSQLT
jgi:hypothetical protein